MRLFLDASVVLAACGRAAGASHAIFDLAEAQDWQLLTGEYVMREVERNVRERLSATAVADVLLTLDRADFGGVMVVGFYGLPVMKPGDFLRRERTARRLAF